MRSYHFAVICIIVLLIPACTSSPKVYTDYDPQQDFSEYVSYSWTSAEPVIINSETPISPLVKERLKQAVKTNMEAKGYTFVESRTDADIAITITVGARDKIEVQQDPNVMFSNDWRWGNRYWMNTPMPVYTDRVVEYTKGTLAIDVFDVRRQAPVWHGVSEKRLSNDQKAGEATFVNAAVSNTLMMFPPQGSSVSTETE